MYENRRDRRCRRFDFGQQRIKFNDSILDGATVSFRRWAKLGSYIPFHLVGVDIKEINNLEKRINKIASCFEVFCNIINWQPYRPSRTFIDFIDRKIFQKKKVYRNTYPLDGFLTTIYNHEIENKTIFIELVGAGAVSLYRTALVLKPGWNEWYKPLHEIPLTNAPRTMINIYFEGDEKGMLTFKYFDFVALELNENKDNLQPAAKVKCVAWDLDNTIWNGVIGDDGPEGVTIREDSITLIKQFDDMGILNTIVSKNNFDIAWNKLVELGLDKYFIYPAINWGRKSQSLLAIAKKININIDTFAVIDDSSFERNEISTALPQVRVFDVVEITNLLSKSEFDIPVTEESKKRREFYQIDSKRNDIFASWSGNYDDFLKDCRLKMSVFNPTTDEDVNRCVELIQRSNQYNVTGIKRNREYMDMILCNDSYKSFGYRVEDKFGKYGIVGFASFKVENNGFLLTDFVMSCRVAQKKVERAFLNWFCNQLSDGTILRIDVNKTNRNMPLRDELKKMPFMIDSDDEKIICMHYTKDGSEFCNDKIIDVTFEY
jgi:FkbH-like protein